MKPRIRLLSLLIILMILLLIFIDEWDTFKELPVRFLEKWESLPPHADALFILLGDSEPRALYTSRLLKEGYAPQVAMGQVGKKAIVAYDIMPDETAVACTVLARSGITNDDIHVISTEVSSTFEEAIAARNWAEESGIDSLIFVTSSYHSRRAYWIVQRVFDSSNITISVATIPVPEIDWRPWWETEEGMVTIFNEFVKHLYYKLTYRNYHD